MSSHLLAIPAFSLISNLLKLRRKAVSLILKLKAQVEPKVRVVQFLPL